MNTPDIGGAMISGRWMNPRTGAVVNVRNVVNDGASVIIITDRGQLSMDEFHDYIQASDEIYDNDGKLIGKESIDMQQLKENTAPIYNDAVNSMKNHTASIEEIDAMFARNGENNKLKQDATVHNATHNHENSEPSSYKMIDKIFNKIDVNIDVDVNIVSDNFPTQELNMLKLYFDVTDDDIADYIRKKFITNDIINNSIQTFISGL